MRVKDRLRQTVQAGPFGPRRWPSRDEVHAFAAEADGECSTRSCRADLDRPGHPLLDRAEAVFTILEHEAMHHETLLYMWHRLPLGTSAGRSIIAGRTWS